MDKHQDDPVVKIFGKTAKQVLTEEPNSSVKGFKTIDAKNGRQILFAMFEVKSINEAYDKAQKALAVINKHNAGGEAQLSLSSDLFTITLHARTQEPLTAQDWVIAKEVE